MGPASQSAWTQSLLPVLTSSRLEPLYSLFVRFRTNLCNGNSKQRGHFSPQEWRLVRCQLLYVVPQDATCSPCQRWVNGCEQKWRCARWNCRWCNQGWFREASSVALTSILLPIGNLCVGGVIDLKDSIEVWTRLQELYQAVFGIRVDTLLEQYQYIRRKPTESVMSYINRISALEKKSSQSMDTN